MTLSFPTTEKPKHAEFHKKVVGRAAEIIVETCNEKGIRFAKNHVPDDALLLALLEEPDVDVYLDLLQQAGANVERLVEAIEQDYRETMSPQYSTKADKDITVKDIPTDNFSSTMQFAMDTHPDPGSFEPASFFHTILALEKVPDAKYRSAYTCKATGAGLNDRMINNTRASTYTALHPSADDGKPSDSTLD